MKRGNKKGTTIMAHDPSMTAWGWAIVDLAGEVLDCGVIQTKPSNKALRIRKGDDRVRRVKEINTEFKRILGLWNPILHVSELPHGSQSAAAAVMLGITVGILQTMGDFTDSSIEFFSEADAKKSVFPEKKKGGKIGKGEMIVAINTLYEVPFTGVGYHDEAVADAMAVYHVAQQQSEVLRFLNR